MNYTKTLLAGVSAAALFAAAPVLAETHPADPSKNAEEKIERSETGVAAAADVAGGKVVFEQKDAEVDVKVPEPDVNVSQDAPVVTVEQGQPEVTDRYLSQTYVCSSRLRLSPSNRPSHKLPFAFPNRSSPCKCRSQRST